MVVPGHPFQRCKFDGFPCFPRGTPMNQFRLVQAVDRFSQRVVLAVPTPTADATFLPDRGETSKYTLTDFGGWSQSRSTLNLFDPVQDRHTGRIYRITRSLALSKCDAPFRSMWPCVVGVENVIEFWLICFESSWAISVESFGP